MVWDHRRGEVDLCTIKRQSWWTIIRVLGKVVDEREIVSFRKPANNLVDLEGARDGGAFTVCRAYDNIVQYLSESEV